MTLIKLGNIGNLYDIDTILNIFRNDDGSLPEIELNNLSIDEVISGYNYIQNSAEAICSIDASYWSYKEKRNIRIHINDDLPNKVIEGEAEPFHICFSGIKSKSQKKLPDLGIFVDTNNLILDYRMGEIWTLDAIEGLFEILLHIHHHCKDMKLYHIGNINDPDGKILHAIWETYKGSITNLN